ncbi:hypothetical protein AN2633.2 [Aspergillus nidulans FGSC A4]|uniref:Uncharacterized protein n=1 Tax=Emericella nidulans (strain FGSC A4 / ATCC 38163 / CBS 112.46 / NRRL 194 / M139) TaxID=227321 RepID=Q5B9Z7_EMENI|nr:hypothetical protein [Aspergillus nidulans FGSC A4]EAA62980.1 hypothetical protein AN2633.2 [Aspergillus nidulans FGSC A4]CBF84316.1 TPA: conserved hypothetical protein [Aspergillus nidulans FGSC A4]|eukprot:XP_660237.1 hypothetical protein AN2633.2 [Aspergillus nidulans FGSC A4]
MVLPLPTYPTPTPEFACEKVRGRHSLRLSVYIGAVKGYLGWDIWGPYETHPELHILTAKDAPFAAIQRAGHGDLVQTPEERTYLAHLMGRPVGQKRMCVLGRETSIQEVY